MNVFSHIEGKCHTRARLFASLCGILQGFLNSAVTCGPEEQKESFAHVIVVIRTSEIRAQPFLKLRGTFLKNMET